MSDEVHIVLVAEFKFMVVQSCFVGNLVRYKLSVVSGWNALVNVLGLIEVDYEVGVYELCHLDIIRKDINWKLQTFSNGHKFFIFDVCFSRVISGNIGATVEGCKWRNPFYESFVSLDILKSDSNLLSIVETAKIKCVIS